jgi:uncharacterized protein with FMN-binding domain
MTKEMKEAMNLNIVHIDLSKIKNGTYYGDYSYKRVIHRVEVTVENSIITKISIHENRTNDYAKMAEGVTIKVIEQQRNNVDAASGATRSSNVLLKAIENALIKGQTNG